MATLQAAPYVDAIFYFPFDLPWVARRVVKAIRPQAFVSLESELWPNVLHELKRQGAATIMVNGRISERNFRRARRMGGLFGWVLSHVDRLLMQSEGDAERARALGGRRLEPGHVAVLGNSKFDQEITPLTKEEVRALRAELQLPEEAPVFVAGSTRSPEEEAQVLLAYDRMRARYSDLCLVIAPRHIQRADEVVAAARAVGLTPVCRTQLAEAETPVRQIVLDTIGELAKVYAVAAFAFVGNSFPPVVKGGGQNILQPLAHGKPVLFGPRTATIRSETALAIEAGVGFRVVDGKALAVEGIRLLENPAERQAIEARALALIAANRGVSARYAEAVVELAKAVP